MTYLHKLLKTPNPPNFGYKDFVVGDIQKHIKRIENLIDSLIKGNEASQTLLILGPNGCGKTLLINIILQTITKKNQLPVYNSVKSQENQNNQSNINFDKRNFTVLFSKIDFLKIEKDSPDLSKAMISKLQRSLYETPEQTYTSITAKILNDISNSIRPNILSLIPVIKIGTKMALSSVLEIYEEALKETLKNTYYTINEIEERIITDKGLIDIAFEKIQKTITNKKIKEKIKEYINNKTYPRILTPYLLRLNTDTSNYKEIHEDELFTHINFQETAVIDQIKHIGELVESKLIIIIIDECNYPKSENINYDLRFLINIINHINEFHASSTPRFLILICGVKEHWENYKLKDEPNQTAYQKLYYNPPIVLDYPNRKCQEELFKNLLQLMICEYNKDIKTNRFANNLINITDGDKMTLIRKFSGEKKHYRELIKNYIEELEHLSKGEN